MTDKDITIQELRGRIAILESELKLHRRDEEANGDGSSDWWKEEMIFWRAKYLKDHPEHSNYDYVSTARENERMDGQIFIPPRPLNVRLLYKHKHDGIWFSKNGHAAYERGERPEMLIESKDDWVFVCNHHIARPILVPFFRKP